jgi:hypothetical protein
MNRGFLNLVDVVEQLVLILQSRDRAHSSLYENLLNELEDVRDSVGDDDGEA